MSSQPPSFDGSGFGLALSGGTARVIAHVGVLQALEEGGLRPSVLAGTSGGALVAVVYASGVDPHRLRELAQQINWRKLAAVRLPRLGLLSSQRIEDLLRDLIGEPRFEDLRIPTYVVTTNLQTGEKTVFHSGKVGRVVRASCSIPQIFGPVEIDGGLYTDGGVIEYLPLETLAELGCKVRVGVNLGAFRDFSTPPRHLLGMILRVISLVATRNARISAPLAQVLIEPDLRGFGSFDLHQADALVEAGYQATLPLLPRIREEMDRGRSRWARLRGRLGLSGEISAGG